MNVEIVDASAMAEILFDQPEADDVASPLEDGHLVGPRLLRYELAKVCLVKLRRRPAERQAIVRAFELRHRLHVQMREVDAVGVVAIAEETGLIAYDASYLWLARFLGVELITLDRRLRAAAHSSTRRGRVRPSRGFVTARVA